MNTLLKSTENQSCAAYTRCRPKFSRKDEMRIISHGMRPIVHGSTLLTQLIQVLGKEDDACLHIIGAGEYGSAW